MAQNFASVQDNAYLPEVLRLQLLGKRVATGAKALPQTATGHLFVVTGRVLIRRLYGVVTTAIQNQADSIKLIGTPTVGTALDLCTALNIANLELGGKVVLPAAVGSALVKQVAGGSNLVACDVVLEAGYVDLNATASNTGAINWVAFWVPEDPNQNSTLVAA